MNTEKRFVISRTDNIGDVVLTLPLAGFLKEKYPDCKVAFIGKKYTKSLIESAQNVDVFWDKEVILENPSILKDFKAETIFFVFPDKDIAQIAQKAKIPTRIGTAHRWWHWWYGNKRVFFSRKKSDLHESQLNFKLLKPLLGEDFVPTFSQITKWYGFTNITDFPEVKKLLSKDKISLIFHPKSKGSGKEWGMENFYQLAKQLQEHDNIQIFITGIKSEEELILKEKAEIFELNNVKNMMGKFSLLELIYFIKQCDGLLSAGTGTLHVAAALGIFAWGIFPPMRPIHPARWQPIGENAHFFAKNVCDKQEQNLCKKQNLCACMQSITVTEVKAKILSDLSKS